MIIFRSRYFSTSGMNKLISKLESSGVEDFEVSSIIPKDCISLTADLGKLQIYFPADMEFFQYDVDSFIRSMVPYMRTSVISDRNIYIMKLSGPLTEAQYIKLVKFIIDEEDFCVIVDDNN